MNLIRYPFQTSTGPRSGPLLSLGLLLVLASHLAANGTGPVQLHLSNDFFMYQSTSASISDGQQLSLSLYASGTNGGDVSNLEFGLIVPPALTLVDVVYPAGGDPASEPVTDKSESSIVPLTVTPFEFSVFFPSPVQNGEELLRFIFQANPGAGITPDFLVELTASSISSLPGSIVLSSSVDPAPVEVIYASPFMLNPTGATPPFFLPNPAISSFSAPNVDNSSNGASAYQFTVTYLDSIMPVSAASIDVNDVVVTGPGGAPLTVTSATEPFGFDVPQPTATYTITPPGGTWDPTDNGTYSISLNPIEVSSTSGLYVVGGAITTFEVNISPLVAYWDFNAKNGAFVPDVSGNVIEGELLGGADLTPDGDGISGTSGDKALDLSLGAAANDIMSVSKNEFIPYSPGMSDFSVSFWVKPTVAGGYADQANTNGYVISTGLPLGDGSKPVAIVLGSGGASGVGWEVPATTTIGIQENDTWQHIALVVDRANAVFHIYINGVAETAYSYAWNPGDVWTPNNIPATVGNIAFDEVDLHIGDQNGNSAFEGLIDDYAIYRIALSPAQVAGLANRTIAPLSVQTTTYEPFSIWSVARGLNPTLNGGLQDDPNKDGQTNRQHFAFDTNPLGNGSDEGKTLIYLLADGGLKYLSFTFPVRMGAVFNTNSPASAAIDGIHYEVEASPNLDAGSWDLGISESGSPLSDPLPSLGDYDGVPGADWEYRTFRLTDPMGTLPKGFIRVDVTEVTP